MIRRENIAPHAERCTWPSGLRLLTETVPGARTVALGIWFDTGSRDESAEHQGITHLIEHMLFKGTRHRSTEALALEMNALGGHFNAYTTQESVCLHARVIGEQLDRALRLLVEMSREGLMEPEELDREQSVIVDEIRMTNDTPDDLIQDLFQEQLWGDTGLGRSILGTPDTVTALRADDLRRHMRDAFTPERIIIAMAGEVDTRQVMATVDELLGDFAAPDTPPFRDSMPTPLNGQHAVERDLEQVHFCLGTLAPPRSSEERYVFSTLTSILGGGASSRLFQEIREKRGLAYSIGTFVSPFQDTGCFGVGGGTGPEQLQEVLDLSLREMRRMAEEPVSDEELSNAKEQARAHLLLGLESMNHRMTRLAELEIFFGSHIALEETLRRLEAVTPKDILEWAEAHLTGAPLTSVILGPGASQVALPASL